MSSLTGEEKNDIVLYYCTLQILIKIKNKKIGGIIMKTKIFAGIAVVAVMLLGLAGCALYGNEAQYAQGDWYFIAGSEEVTRIQQDKLAFKKLESQPAQVAFKEGVPQGYSGLVINLSKYTRYNFIISGPERKGYLLGPNESVDDNLIPGTYACAVYRAGRQIGQPWVFHVTAQKHIFMGKEYHWYIYME
ncbi:MAG: hypothetical protein Q8N21_04650 [bacterium]|nr:hypothetical protein [bacterium]